MGQKADREFLINNAEQMAVAGLGSLAAKPKRYVHEEIEWNGQIMLMATYLGA